MNIDLSLTTQESHDLAHEVLIKTKHIPANDCPTDGHPNNPQWKPYYGFLAASRATTCLEREDQAASLLADRALYWLHEYEVAA